MADAGNGGPLHPNAAPFSPLNFDILVTVMSFVEKKSDLISAMCTCRASYEAGILLLLSFHIRVRPEDLPWFHQYLKQPKEDLTRYRALRDLELVSRELDDVQKPSQEEIEIMTDILQHATNLECLTCYAVLPLASRTISLAITSLTKLRYLDLIDDWNEEEEYILSHLECPLETMKMWCVTEKKWDSVDPIRLLSKFRNTLKTLMITDIETIAPPPGLRFLHVTHLELSNWNHPKLSPFIETFPNVKEFGIELSEPGEPPDEYERSIITLRNENIACHSAPSGWRKSLTALKGDLLGLYTAGVQHEVESLNVWHGPFDAPQNKQVAWLRSVLEPIKPRYLFISSPLNASGWSEALAVGLERLERLDLCCDFQPGMINNHENTDVLLASLGRSNLRVLYCTMYSKDTASAQDFLQYFFSRAPAAIPTLEAIKLKLWHSRGVVNILALQCYWLVSEEDNRLIRVSPADHATLAEIDALCLPDQY